MRKPILIAVVTSLVLSATVQAGCGGMRGVALRKCEQESSQLIIDYHRDQETDKMDVESLIETVTDPHASHRKRAASILGWNGIHTDASLRALAEASRSKDISLSIAAMKALTQIVRRYSFQPAMRLVSLGYWWVASRTMFGVFAQQITAWYNAYQIGNGQTLTT